MNDLQSLQDSGGLTTGRLCKLCMITDKLLCSVTLHESMDRFITTLIILKVKKTKTKQKNRQGNLKRPAHMAINSARLSCSSVQSAETEAPPEPNKMTSNRLQVRIRDVAKTA